MTLSPAQTAAQRIEELEIEVSQLRDLLAPQIEWPLELRLTPLERRFLSALFARAPEAMQRERLMAAVYPDPDTAPMDKIVDQMILRLRRKLTPHGAYVASGGHHGGWYLDARSVAVLNGLRVSAVRKVGR